MPAISRARTGCWSCRARRVKCDETHPICHRCARNDSPCGYGVRLTWREESLARGVCHGRAGVWAKKKDSDRAKGKHQKQPGASQTDGLLWQRKKSPTSSQGWMFLNTSTNDLEIFFRGARCNEKGMRTERPSPWLSTIPAGQRSDCDPVLMSYFEHIICSSSTLVDNVHYNPYRYLILPMALQSKGLYHATLAIAGNTLRLSDPKYHLLALEHHNYALGYLRGLLEYDTWQEKELDEMLGLVLMLCWFDISDSSRPSWVTHLNGFQDLIRARQKRPYRSVHSQEMSSFFSRYFAFHLVLARTAFDVNSSTFPGQSAIPHDYVESPDTIDPYMGFSHSLLLLINQVAELAADPQNENQRARTARIYQLKSNLESLEQRLPADNLDPNTECVAIAEANRLGALLLLHEVCSPSLISTRGTQLSSPNIEDKSGYVERILLLILSKKSNMMRTAVLPLWPLFLAGCCVRTEEERVIVLQLFEELESIQRFGNIAPAMEVIQMVWRQRDLSVQDERERQRKTSGHHSNDSLQGARFSWEYAMAVLGGWKVSLT